MAVKKYSLKKQGNEYCSKHTKVKEMACVDSDTVLIDESLMEMIDKLYAKLRCSKYLISSGYRTSAHDKAVGGNGKGQHTKGTAVDACFYDKDGKIIPAQVVCCVAQDLGFKGIANISKNYRYVHLDMRTSGKYYGDEIKSYNTVTSDFRKYFGVKETEIAKYTGAKVEKPVKYFKKYTGESVSIITALNEIGATSTYAYRGKIASANGIKGYSGTASQNTKLLDLLKKGKLIKP